MSEFINTTSVIGDDAVCDGIIEKTITEIKDDRVDVVAGEIFYDCKALLNAEFPNATKIAYKAFYGCTALKGISIPNVKALEHNAFCYASSVEILDLPKCEKIDESALYGMSSLEAIILRNTAGACVIDSWSTLAGHAADRCIFVPRTFDDGSDGVEAYKAATNWSVYAEWIGAIEDYTVDGTLTGELTPVLYTALYKLAGVSSSNLMPRVGPRYYTTLTSSTPIGEIVVTMGGVDVTAEVYDAETGKISIPHVTGDLVIAAKIAGTPTQIEYSVADMSGVLEVKTGGYYGLSGTWVNASGYQSWKVPCTSGEKWEQYSTSGYGMYKVLLDDDGNFVSSFTPAGGNPTAFTIPDGDGVAYMWTAIQESDITDSSFRLVRQLAGIAPIHSFAAANATSTVWVDEMDDSYQFDFTGSPTVADGYVNFTSSSYGILNKNLGLNGVDSTLVVRFVADSSASETWVLGTPNWSNGVIIGKKSGNFHIEASGGTLIQCAEADANEHEVALCFDSSTNTMHAYFDGVSCGSATVSATRLNNLIYLNNEGASFNAANKVAHILIYDRMLTADEVADLFVRGG